jgi:hypothetical protein
MLVPSGIHAKYSISRNAESSCNPRLAFLALSTQKITHSIPRRPRNVVGNNLGQKVALTCRSQSQTIGPKTNEPMLRILVTGGAGYIGSALCRYLAGHRGDIVINVDKMYPSVSGRLADEVKL